MRTTSRRVEAHRVRDITELAAEWPAVVDENGRRARWDPPPNVAPPPDENRPTRGRSRWEGPAREDPDSDFDDDEFESEPDGRNGRGKMRLIVVVLLLVVAAALAGTLAIAQQSPKADDTVASVPKPADREAIVESKAIGDWVYGCINQDRPAPKQCFIRQQLADGNTKTPVFTWTLGRGPKGDIVAVWQTPTGVMVGAGVVLDIGGDKPIPVPYRACTRGQCQAVANLEAEFVERLGAAEKLRATIVSSEGKGIAFDFSVKGLADGIAALKN